MLSRDVVVEAAGLARTRFLDRRTPMTFELYDEGDDDDEVGDACGDEDDGGREAFSHAYLKSLNTEELMCLDANLYDAAHLDKEDEVNYSQGMDEEAKRVAELEADLLKVQDCLARRDALLNVSVHYRNIC